MSIKKSSVRPPVRLSAVLAVVALAAAACGGGASTVEGAPATVGPEGAAASSAPASSVGGEGGGAVSSPATTATAPAPTPSPAPAPTMTDDEYDETIGRELAELDEPAGPPPDNEDQDQAHDHDNGDGHDHDDTDTGDGDGSGPATGETPASAEETETATTAPAADETPAGDPQPDPEPVVEPEPDEWQDTAPVLEPVDATDSGEIRNLHEYWAFTDGNYVYLSTLICDPQPGFCNETYQEFLANQCVNPIGLLYPGLRIRHVFTPSRNPITGDLVWSVTFYRVKAIEYQTGGSVGAGRLQWFHVGLDRWDYQYFSETEPAEYSAWMDAFPTTAPHSSSPWHNIAEVPGGHARDMGDRITFESEGRMNPCEGEYPGA